MGDREPLIGNRLVADKYNKHKYTLHRNNVNNIQPAVKTAPPPILPHLVHRPKRDQLAKERAQQIERENAILLRKMEAIATKRDPSRTHYAPPGNKPGSLNNGKRRRELLEIMRENENLLKRLQAKRPVYSVQQFERDNAVHQERRNRISKFGNTNPRVAYSSPSKPSRSQASNDHNSSANPALKNNRTRSSGGNNPTLPPLKHTQSREGSASASKPTEQTSTCIFSQPSTRIGGITSIVSIYERLNPYRLDILARDIYARSTMQPVSIPFRDLRQIFQNTPDILAPPNTIPLVHAILPSLWWLEQGPALSLQLTVDKIVSDPEQVQALLEQGEQCEVIKPLTEGMMVSVKCGSIPTSCSSSAAFMWLHNAGKFEYIDRTDSVTDSLSPVYAKSLCVPITTLWDGCMDLSTKPEDVLQNLANTTLLRIDVCKMQDGAAQEVIASVDCDIRLFIPLDVAKYWILQSITNIDEQITYSESNFDTLPFGNTTVAEFFNTSSADITQNPLVLDMKKTNLDDPTTTSNTVVTTITLEISEESKKGVDKLLEKYAELVAYIENTKQKRAEETRLEEEARIKAEKEAEEARLAEEARVQAEKEAEEARIQAEKEAEEARIAEEARVQAEKEAEEARIKAEKEAEEARLAEEARIQAEKEAEEARLADDARRAEEARIKAEEARIKAEKEAEEARLAEEARIKADKEAEEARLKAEKEAEEARLAEEERIKAEKEAKEARLKAEKEAEADVSDAEDTTSSPQLEAVTVDENVKEDSPLDVSTLSSDSGIAGFGDDVVEDQDKELGMDKKEDDDNDEDTKVKQETEDGKEDAPVAAVEVSKSKNYNDDDFEFSDDEPLPSVETVTKSADVEPEANMESKPVSTQAQPSEPEHVDTHVVSDGSDIEHDDEKEEAKDALVEPSTSLMQPLVQTKPLDDSESSSDSLLDFHNVEGAVSDDDTNNSNISKAMNDMKKEHIEDADTDAVGTLVSVQPKAEAQDDLDYEDSFEPFNTVDMAGDTDPVNPATDNIKEDKEDEIDTEAKPASTVATGPEEPEEDDKQPSQPPVSSSRVPEASLDSLDYDDFNFED